MDKDSRIEMIEYKKEIFCKKKVKKICMHYANIIIITEG